MPERDCRRRFRQYGSRFAAVVLLALCAVTPALAYTVFLKDGTKLIARSKYTISNGMAIIVLQNGTTTSIRANEIDVERTEKADQGNYGTALVIDDAGQGTGGRPATADEERARLQGLIASRQIGPRETAPVRRESTDPRPGATAEPPATRSALPQAELAAQIQKLFREQGVEEVAVLRGKPNRPLLEVTANSEATMFRALNAAATVLSQIQGGTAKIEGFEVALATSGRESAGRFALTPAMAAELTGKQIQVSAFFVKYVQF
jgi:hypothetical protein